MNEYLTIFDNHSDYEKFTNTDKFIFPNVTCCVNNDDIHYNTDYPYEYVDMGLPSGTMWCTKNLGAVLPINDGNYYMYGDTTPYRRPDYESINKKIGDIMFNDDLTDKQKQTQLYELFIELQWENYSKYTFAKITSKDEYLSYIDNGNEDESPSNIMYTKYNTTDNKMVLDDEDDPVVSIIGGYWKSSSFSQMNELINNCSISLETINNKKVFVLTSRYNGNKLIFPMIYEYSEVPNDQRYLEDLKLCLIRSNELVNNHESYESVLLSIYYGIGTKSTSILGAFFVGTGNGFIDECLSSDCSGDSYMIIDSITRRYFPMPIRPIYVPPASIENMYKRFKNSQSSSGAPIAPTYGEIDLLNDYIKNKFEADNNVDLDDPNYTGPIPRYINKTSQQNYIYFYTIGGSDDYDNEWYDYDTDEVKHSGNLCLFVRSNYKYHHFALDSEYNIIDYRYGGSGGGDVK